MHFDSFPAAMSARRVARLWRVMRRRTNTKWLARPERR
jgi:hypothetical protein